MLPEVGSVSRTIARPRVVLPQPLSPTSPSVSRASIENVTSSTALTYDLTRLKTPCFTGKWTLSCLTSSKLIGVQTANESPGLDLHQRRHRALAFFPCARATRKKSAPWREIANPRHVAGNRNQALRAVAQFGHRIEQRFGVWMQWA